MSQEIEREAEFDQSEYEMLENMLLANKIHDEVITEVKTEIKEIVSAKPIINHYKRFKFDEAAVTPDTNRILIDFCTHLDKLGELNYLPNEKHIINYIQFLQSALSLDSIYYSTMMKTLAMFMIVFDTYYKDRWDLITLDSYNRIGIAAYYPEFVIEDSDGETHTIKDLYGIYKFSGSTYTELEILYTRITITEEEASSNYFFSHGNFPSNRMMNGGYYGKVCAGSGEIKTMMGQVPSLTSQDSLTIEFVTLLALQLEEFFKYEYIPGSPMKNIQAIGFGGHFSVPNLLENHFLKEFVDKISLIPGVAVKNSYFGLISYLPNINKELFARLIEFTYVPKCFLDTNDNSYFNSSNPIIANNSDAFRFKGNLMIIFREEQKYLKIIKEESKQVVILTQTIHPATLRLIHDLINKLLFIHSIRNSYDKKPVKKRKAKLGTEQTSNLFRRRRAVTLNSQSIVRENPTSGTISISGQDYVFQTQTVSASTT